MILELDSESVRWLCRVGLFVLSIIFSGFSASGIFLLLFDAINRSQDELLTFEEFKREIEHKHLLPLEKEDQLDETFYQL